MLVFQFAHGDAIFFAGTICLAVYMLAMKKLQRDEPKVCFTVYSLLAATAALLVTAVWRTGGLPLPNAGAWLGIAYLAGPYTAGTFWILQHTAPRLAPPSRVVAYTLLNRYMD